MTIKSKLISGAIAIALLALLFAAGAHWLQSYVAHQVADALISKEIKDTAAANAKLEQANKDLAAQILDLTTSRNQVDAGLDKQKTDPVTASQLLALRLQIQQLTAKTGKSISVPATDVHALSNGTVDQVTMVGSDWRNLLVDVGKCENGLGTCEAVQAKQSEQIANLTEQRDGLKRNLDDLAKVKAPYIPPRNNLLFGVTSDHGGIVLVTHRLKWFGDRFSIGAGAQASGFRESRLFVVAGIPLGK